MKLTSLYKPIFYLLLLGSFSCKKLIEVDLPINVNTSETVFKEKLTAMAALIGIYEPLANEGPISPGWNGVSIRVGFMADELTPLTPQAFLEYGNHHTGDIGWNFWIPAYRETIHGINSIIEGVQKSADLPISVKRQITAEAKFLRAWIYFYLVNFYGDVPLALTTNFKENSMLPRAPVQTVYEQIVKDLLEAEEDINNDYTQTNLTSVSTERIRASKAVVRAFLARVYLYMEKWQEAEHMATLVIDDPRFELLSDLNAVFLKNSKEAIWQLQPNPNNEEGANAPDARYFINPYNEEPFFHISEYVIDAFEPMDLRRDKWVTTTPGGQLVVYKYKKGWGVHVQTEYTVALRLAEQYLIRAEARMHLGKLTGTGSAAEDVNKVRTRAGLSETTATTTDAMLDAILHERQVELFLEWGHRWLDLKRTGRLDAVMKEVVPGKGGVWASFKALLPIPYDEFKYYPALRGHQNPGYQEQP